MLDAAEAVRRVRQCIYEVAASTGAVPRVDDVARLLMLDRSTVATAFRTLADLHVIVLMPGTLEPWTAPPFAAAPSAFRVRSGGVTWFAPCAWDAFGIPAATHRDATIGAVCAWSGESVAAGVAGGEAFGEGVIHLLVPASRFWDDIFYT